MNIRETTRSDELVDLRPLFTGDGLFAWFGQLVQINLILDANSVLEDLRWLAFKARDPAARTSLMEAIDSQTIVAFAPTYLSIEVEKNIRLIAEEEGVEPSRFVEKWQSYKPRINFIECGGPEDHAVDPKDVPYVKLHQKTDYPVLTKDEHISRMGAKVVTVEVTTLAKKYGREAVIEYKIKMGFLGTFIVSANLVKAASEFGKAALNYARNVPFWVWVMVIGGFIYALSFEGLRKWLMQKIGELPASVSESARALLTLLEPVVFEHHKSQMAALECKKELLRETEA